MIERYRDSDLIYTYDVGTETISFEIVSGDELERVSVSFTAIDYEPEMYERIANSLNRIAARLRKETEQYEYEEDEDDD